MSAIAKRRTPTEIDAIFAELARITPEPKTELVAPDAFTMLVAIVLSAQATDVSVNKATASLFKVAATPQKMLALGEAGLKNYIKTIGLYNAKAKNVMALCKQLIEAHGGAVPATREALETLAGVGRKTANVWLNNVMGVPTIGVDTHVFRVSNRLGLCHTLTPMATEEKLEKVIPDHWKRHAHHWLILHGRYICKARKPECWRCPVVQWCGYKEKNLQADA